MQERIAEPLGQAQRAAADLHVSCPLRPRPAAACPQARLSRTVRHLRSRRSGEPGPQRAARNSRAQRAAAAGRFALSDQPLENGLDAAGRRRERSQERQGTPGRDGLSPLSKIAANGRRRRFRRFAAADRRAVSRNTPTCAATRPALFDHLLVDEYQDTNGSQYRDHQGAWRPSIAICASSATTTNRSTAGAGPRCSTSCASPAIGPTPRSFAWRTTTARRRPFSKSPTG